MPLFPAVQTATRVRPDTASDGVAFVRPATPKVACAGFAATARTDPPVPPATPKPTLNTTPITPRRMLGVIVRSSYLWRGVFSRAVAVRCVYCAIDESGDGNGPSVRRRN